MDFFNQTLCTFDKDSILTAAPALEKARTELTTLKGSYAELIGAGVQELLPPGFDATLKAAKEQEHRAELTRHEHLMCATLKKKGTKTDRLLGLTATLSEILGKDWKAVVCPELTELVNPLLIDA